MTDGEVSTDGRHHRQPRARHDERVDDAVVVRHVDECEAAGAVVARVRVEDGEGHDDDAEEHVGDGERHQPGERELLHAAHVEVEAPARQHEQVERVADHPEHADGEHHLAVKRRLQTAQPEVRQTDATARRVLRPVLDDLVAPVGHRGARFAVAVHFHRFRLQAKL